MQLEQGQVRAPRGLALAASLAAFALVYVALARLGLLFSLSDALASPVWPPTGLAIAGVALWGRRMLPAVFVGAAVTEALASHSLPIALLLATGNTLEAALGGWLVGRAGGSRAFETLPGLLRFTTAAAVAPLAASLCGATVLLLFGIVPASAAGPVWWTWYLGDAAGAFVVTPVLLLAMRGRVEPWPRARQLELAALLAAVAMLCVLVFGLAPGVDLPGLPLVFLMMPVVVWCAFRQGPAVSALLVMVLDIVAVAVTRQGRGPFAAVRPDTAFLFLQAFVFTIGFMTLALAAMASERRRNAAVLEERVRERTARLEELNGLLRAEALERRRAQEQAAEAQRIAGIGSWTWDIPANRVSWSDELHRILGRDPATFQASYEAYLDTIHADDRDRVASRVQSAIAHPGAFAFDHRIVRPDGQVRHVHCEARMDVDASGHAMRMVGVSQDVTEPVAQEAKFRDLLEAAPDAMVIAGEDGAIVLVNGQAERLFGYTRQELLGQPIESLVPTALRGVHEGHRAAYAKDARTRPMGAGIDLRARRKDGSEFPVEISLSPLETPQGRFVSSAIRDITQRKEAERALNESLERFRALADASPIGIVHTRADGIVDYVNDRWRQITGVADHTDREAMRLSVHPEDQPKMAALWRSCVSEGREFGGDMRFVHRDGVVRWTRARAVPVRDAAGKITGFVSALADITDQRAVEAQEREVTRLREQAEFKTNFLRTAAHELGTPLTPIQIQTHILSTLLADSPRADERKAIEILERNISRLRVLVRDMLESARLQSGRLRLDPRPIDLAHVVHDVVETFQEPAILAGIRLDTRGPHELPVVADPDRLSQVLYNLLSNAMKFTPMGGHIGVALAREGDQVRVSVTDSGEGFTAEQRAKLFQPFTQLHEPLKSKHGGSGLGLYICKGIVEQHGGSIDATSPGPGLGATVSFVVPRVAHQLPVPTVAEATERMQREESHASQQGQRPQPRRSESP